MNTPAPHDPDFESWPPRQDDAAEDAMPGWATTLGRGLLGRCPRCGCTPMFDGYLKVHPQCAHCAAPLGEMPADDAPPYIAMLVVLQILAVFVVLFYKGTYDPDIFMAGFMLILLVAACMVALRLAKGAVIGILLKLGLKREVLNG